MPILDHSYRRYEALAPLNRTRFWPITREALRQLGRRRYLLLLFLLAWLPLVFAMAWVVAVTRLPEVGRLIPVDTPLFGDFLGVQVYFALFASAIAGAGLVADDLRTGGILLYLSRPLSRRDYVLGKLGVLLGLNLGLTVVPALVLWLAAVGLAPARFLTFGLAWLPLAILAQGGAATATLSLLALASSSLTRRAWVAGLGLVAGVMILDLVGATLRHVLDLPRAEMLSPLGALRLLAGALFGTPHRGGTDALLALAAIAVPAALAVVVLRARVRAVEVVR